MPQGRSTSPERSADQYIHMCSQYGAQAGMTNEEMRAYCEKLFPTLKRWRKLDCKQ